MIFKKFGMPFSVVIYGDPSPELLENAKAGGMDVKNLYVIAGTLNYRTCCNYILD